MRFFDPLQILADTVGDRLADLLCTLGMLPRSTANAISSSQFVAHEVDLHVQPGGPARIVEALCFLQLPSQVIQPLTVGSSGLRIKQSAILGAPKSRNAMHGQLLLAHLPGVCSSCCGRKLGVGDRKQIANVKLPTGLAQHGSAVV